MNRLLTKFSVNKVMVEYYFSTTAVELFFKYKEICGLLTFNKFSVKEKMKKNHWLTIEHSW